MTLDPTVLLFTLGVSVFTGILFGLVPAISASSPNLAATLNESSSRSGIGFRSGKLRSVLVVTEMALALVLVIGAALLIRTFMKLEAVDPGFDTHNVLTMTMSISGDRFQKICRSRAARPRRRRAHRDGTRSCQRGRIVLPADAGRLRAAF